MKPTVSPQERALLIRIHEIGKLIEDQREYLAQLEMRQERLRLDLTAVRRKAA